LVAVQDKQLRVWRIMGGGVGEPRGGLAKTWTCRCYASEAGTSEGIAPTSDPKMAVVAKRTARTGKSVPRTEIRPYAARSRFSAVLPLALAGPKGDRRRMSRFRICRREVRALQSISHSLMETK
jgi:hypothetical protein